MCVLPGRVTRGRKNPLHFGLPRRLKRERKQAKLARSRLALTAGLSINVVGNIEERVNVPGVDVVEKLADALHVSPCLLAYGEEHPHEATTAARYSGLPMRLRQAREFRLLGLRALGESSGTSHPTVLQIEEGQIVPRVDT